MWTRLRACAAQAEWPPEGEQEQEHILWWSEAQLDSLDGSGEAYSDAVAVREEVALATRVLKSLIGASVRKAYKASGKPVRACRRIPHSGRQGVRACDSALGLGSGGACAC